MQKKKERARTKWLLTQLTTLVFILITKNVTHKRREHVVVAVIVHLKLQNLQKKQLAANAG